MYFGLYFLGGVLVITLVFQRVKILKVCERTMITRMDELYIRKCDDSLAILHCIDFSSGHAHT